jgi:sugar transferase EpsL
LTGLGRASGAASRFGGVQDATSLGADDGTRKRTEVERHVCARRGRRRHLAAKRAIDVVGAGLGLIVLSPVLLIAAVAVLLTLGRPVLFRQVRPGLQGKPFTIVKLRTMRAAEEGETFYRTDEARLTRLGRLLRRSSIDELPELWNVLKGDMSLVGPRPLLMSYLEKYTDEQRRRHAVRPGITGWAQVQGRQEIPFSRRLDLDVWYVDHWSLGLDARILAATVRQTLSGRGVVNGQALGDVDDLGLLDERTGDGAIPATRAATRRHRVTPFTYAGHTLRPPLPKDADRLLVLKNDRETSRLLGGYNDGYTRQEIAAWIRRHRAAQGERVWVIVDERDRCVGHMGLYDIDERVGSAEFGILIGPGSRGHGLGEACLRYALDYAWNALGLRRISLRVLATNERAARLYRRVGFVDEGVLRGAQLKDGEYIDVVLMAIVRDA